jgi:hypothetical protein
VGRANKQREISVRGPEPSMIAHAKGRVTAIRTPGPIDREGTERRPGPRRSPHSPGSGRFPGWVILMVPRRADPSNAAQVYYLPLGSRAVLWTGAIPQTTAATRTGAVRAPASLHPRGWVHAPVARL